LLLASADATRDAALFRDAGIAASDALHFEREGRRPDGRPVTVGFSLAFARDAAAPDIGFAACHHHTPEAFWNPDFQVHPNGATGVAGVVVVAENPSEHDVFLSAVAGKGDRVATSSGITVTTPRGTIQVMDPLAYARHFGVAPPDAARGARLAALIIAVRDRQHIAALLERVKIPAVNRMERIVVGPQQMMGATIVFERA
jgi:hypothetical protein